MISSLPSPMALETSSANTTTSTLGSKWRNSLPLARPRALASATYVPSSHFYLLSLTPSQYSKKYLEQLLPHASIVPAINQIENHPSLPQQEIVDLCNEKGIHIVSYSPLGSTGGPLMSAEPVVKIAEKKGVSASTVLLSYHGKSQDESVECDRC